MISTKAKRSTIDHEEEQVIKEPQKIKQPMIKSHHREKLEKKHIERIDEYLKVTAVGGDINKQRANVCISCDQIIFGVEPVKQLSKGQLLENDTILFVSQY